MQVFFCSYAGRVFFVTRLTCIPLHFILLFVYRCAFFRLYVCFYFVCTLVLYLPGCVVSVRMHSIIIFLMQVVCFRSHAYCFVFVCSCVCVFVFSSACVFVFPLQVYCWVGVEVCFFFRMHVGFFVFVCR